MEQKKIRIGLIFGGRSGEHEVSLASAESVMANLDRDKYEVVPIGITKEGSGLLGMEPRALLAAEQSASHDASLEGITAVTLDGDPFLHRLSSVENAKKLQPGDALHLGFHSFLAPHAD